MALSNPKLHLLSFAALFLMLANNAHSQDTTSFTYNDFNPQPYELTYQGDAHVQSDSTFLLLTQTSASGYPKTYSVGRVVYSPPIHFWDCHVEDGYSRQASFETNFDITITRVGNNPADGIAFFFVPVDSTIPSGSTGGNLGLYDSSGTASSTFAVEFDNYVNGWDPPYRHIGVNVNSRSSMANTEFDSALGQNVHVQIEYVATTKTIRVNATVGSRRVTLSNVVVNLESILPEYVQVGITGSTGAQVALHFLKAWEFSSTLERESDINPKCDYYAKEHKYIRQYE